jgi:hypothetical protein
VKLEVLLVFDGEEGGDGVVAVTGGWKEAFSLTVWSFCAVSETMVLFDDAEDDNGAIVDAVVDAVEWEGSSTTTTGALLPVI